MMMFLTQGDQNRKIGSDNPNVTDSDFNSMLSKKCGTIRSHERPEWSKGRLKRGQKHKISSNDITELL